ncbi:hypothetical protein ABPG75_000241 [Micractinium tetrahymenae]
MRQGGMPRSADAARAALRPRMWQQLRLPPRALAELSLRSATPPQPPCPGPWRQAVAGGPHRVALLEPLRSVLPTAADVLKDARFADPLMPALQDDASRWPFEYAEWQVGRSAKQRSLQAYLLTTIKEYDSWLQRVKVLDGLAQHPGTKDSGQVRVMQKDLADYLALPLDRRLATCKESGETLPGEALAPLRRLLRRSAAEQEARAAKEKAPPRRPLSPAEVKAAKARADKLLAWLLSRLSGPAEELPRQWQAVLSVARLPAEQVAAEARRLAAEGTISRKEEEAVLAALQRRWQGSPLWLSLPDYVTGTDGSTSDDSGSDSEERDAWQDVECAGNLWAPPGHGAGSSCNAAPEAATALAPGGTCPPELTVPAPAAEAAAPVAAPEAAAVAGSSLAPGTPPAVAAAAAAAGEAGQPCDPASEGCSHQAAADASAPAQAAVAAGSAGAPAGRCAAEASAAAATDLLLQATAAAGPDAASLAAMPQAVPPAATSVPQDEHHGQQQQPHQNGAGSCAAQQQQQQPGKDAGSGGDAGRPRRSRARVALHKGAPGPAMAPFQRKLQDALMVPHLLTDMAREAGSEPGAAFLQAGTTIALYLGEEAFSLECEPPPWGTGSLFACIFRGPEKHLPQAADGPGVAAAADAPAGGEEPIAGSSGAGTPDGQQAQRADSDSRADAVSFDAQLRLNAAFGFSPDSLVPAEAELAAAMAAGAEGGAAVAAAAEAWAATSPRLVLPWRDAADAAVRPLSQHIFQLYASRRYIDVISSCELDEDEVLSAAQAVARGPAAEHARLVTLAVYHAVTGLRLLLLFIELRTVGTPGGGGGLAGDDAEAEGLLQHAASLWRGCMPAKQPGSAEELVLGFGGDESARARRLGLLRRLMDRPEQGLSPVEDLAPLVESVVYDTAAPGAKGEQYAHGTMRLAICAALDKMSQHRCLSAGTAGAVLAFLHRCHGLPMPKGGLAAGAVAGLLQDLPRRRLAQLVVFLGTCLCRLHHRPASLDPQLAFLAVARPVHWRAGQLELSLDALRPFQEAVAAAAAAPPRQRDSDELELDLGDGHTGCLRPAVMCLDPQDTRPMAQALSSMACGAPLLRLPTADKLQHGRMLPLNSSVCRARHWQLIHSAIERLGYSRGVLAGCVRMAGRMAQRRQELAAELRACLQRVEAAAQVSPSIPVGMCACRACCVRRTKHVAFRPCAAAAHSAVRGRGPIAVSLACLSLHCALCAGLLASAILEAPARKPAVWCNRARRSALRRLARAPTPLQAMPASCPPEVASDLANQAACLAELITSHANTDAVVSLCEVTLRLSACQYEQAVLKTLGDELQQQKASRGKKGARAVAEQIARVAARQQALQTQKDVLEKHLQVVNAWIATIDTSGGVLAPDCTDAPAVGELTAAHRGLLGAAEQLAVRDSWDDTTGTLSQAQQALQRALRTLPMLRHDPHTLASFSAVAEAAGAAAFQLFGILVTEQCAAPSLEPVYELMIRHLAAPLWEAEAARHEAEAAARSAAAEAELLGMEWDEAEGNAKQQAGSKKKAKKKGRKGGKQQGEEQQAQQPAAAAQQPATAQQDAPLEEPPTDGAVPAQAGGQALPGRQSGGVQLHPTTSQLTEYEDALQGPEGLLEAMEEEEQFFSASPSPLQAPSGEGASLATALGVTRRSLEEQLQGADPAVGPGAGAPEDGAAQALAEASQTVEDDWQEAPARRGGKRSEAHRAQQQTAEQRQQQRLLRLAGQQAGPGAEQPDWQQDEREHPGQQQEGRRRQGEQHAGEDEWHEAPTKRGSKASRRQQLAQQPGYPRRMAAPQAPPYEQQQQGQEGPVIVQWSGHWLCPCGHLNLPWTHCRSCGSLQPCRRDG